MGIVIVGSVIILSIGKHYTGFYHLLFTSWLIVHNLGTINPLMFDSSAKYQWVTMLSFTFVIVSYLIKVLCVGDFLEWEVRHIIHCKSEFCLDGMKLQF
jgi:hypothetical protein